MSIALVIPTVETSSERVTSHTCLAAASSSATPRTSFDLPPRNWSSKMWYNGPEKGDLLCPGRAGRRRRSSGLYGRRTRGCRSRRYELKYKQSVTENVTILISLSVSFGPAKRRLGTGRDAPNARHNKWPQHGLGRNGWPRHSLEKWVEKRPCRICNPLP